MTNLDRLLCALAGAVGGAVTAFVVLFRPPRVH